MGPLPMPKPCWKDTVYNEIYMIYIYIIIIYVYIYIIKYNVHAVYRNLGK